MEIHQYLDKKKKLQYNLLRFIENDRNVEENFLNLIPLINDQNIHQDPQELQAFLYLLMKITNNFNRSSTFFHKIEKIILYIKNDILKHLTNYQIFNIFKSNKRILLFILQEKILIPDKSITITLQQKKFKKFNYIKFLYPELNTKIVKIDVLNKQNFDEKRKIGENDDYICELIRNDSIDEFISLVKKKRFHIKMIIDPSIFETNNFLLKNQPNLIEYSAFFGSIQIFKYLHMNGIELKPSIWIYAIHGRNPEMINYIEERKIKPESNSFFECIKESIKCHHNEIVNYIQNNLFETNNGLFELGVKYYNYEFFIDEFINNDNDIETIFYQFCRYNYIYLVKFLLKTKKIQINKKINNVF